MSTATPCRVLVENKPGVLARIAGLFSRRGFNIESLAVGPTEHAEVSRMTIVVNVEDSPLEQVTKQLNKLVEVIKIVELDQAASVHRELLLVKVAATTPRPAARSSTSSSCSRPASSTSRPTRSPIQVTGNADKIADVLPDPRAVRDPRARPVRHGRDRPRLPLDLRAVAAPGRRAHTARAPADLPAG